MKNDDVIDCHEKLLCDIIVLDHILCRFVYVGVLEVCYSESSICPPPLVDSWCTLQLLPLDCAANSHKHYFLGLLCEHLYAGGGQGGEGRSSQDQKQGECVLLLRSASNFTPLVLWQQQRMDVWKQETE